MSLTLHPDPQEPAGGFAFFELPDGTLTEDQVTVAVLETYGERWLALSDSKGERVEIGNPNWQSERFEFGPYDVHRHDGADWVRIGPEIVNKLEEYTPLRIHIGPVVQDVAWPDDLPPRAGAAVLGGLQTVARSKTLDDSAPLVGKVQTAEPVVESVQEVELPVVEDEVETPPESNRNMLILLVILLLLIAAALAWYFLYYDKDPVEEPGQNTTETPVVSGDPCTFGALSGLSGGFAVTEQAIRDCGRDVSPDTALRLIEEAAEQNDPQALLLFGTLYDGDELDARIENLITLSFDDDPARAVEYYSRAAAAGSEKAQMRLDATCARLPGSNATLAKGAYDDFCQ